MNKPEVHFRSHGRSGNIYAILVKVQEALKAENRITEWNNLWEEVHNTGDYKEALAVIRKTINLIDDDGKY